MKRILLLVSVLLIATQVFAQTAGTLPIGGKTTTTEIKGTFLVDSNACLPWGDTARISHAPGMDTVNRQLIVNRSDSAIYYLYKGKWIKLLSIKDSGVVANIYNKDGTLTGTRTLLGGGFDLSMTGIHHFTISTTNALDLFGGTGAYMNLNTPLGITMQGGKVNTAVKTVAYGSRDTILVNDGTYDHEFTSGSGVSFAYLPTATSAPTGQEYIIGDAKAISGLGSTITIDAGAGNVISSSRGSSSQTYVINTNGEVAHLKKLGPSTWLLEGGGNAGIDTGTIVGNATANRILAVNATGQIITPWAIQWDDINKYFEISHAFRYDSVHHTWAMGDYSAIHNSTWWSLDDAAQTWGVNANNGTTVTALTGDVNIVAQNLRNYGGVINGAITNYAFGTTQTMAFAGSVFHDIQFTGSTGAATLNLPLSPPLGYTLIISDLDAICAANNITLDAGSGKVIVGSTSARTFVMSTNGQAVRLKYVAANKWKVE